MQYNSSIIEDVLRLRDELALKAFDANGNPQNSTLAEIVFKLNGCLFKGYPRKCSMNTRNSSLKVESK